MNADSILILITDLRTSPARLEHFSVAWRPEITAYQAVLLALGDANANLIEGDLASGNKALIASWFNTVTGEHSEVGGLASLNWAIPGKSVLTIGYENQTTTQSQIDEATAWALQVTSHIDWPPPRNAFA